MNLVVEFLAMVKDKVSEESPISLIKNPPEPPMVGDITPGPDGKLWRIVQRSYVMEHGSVISHTHDILRIQCVIRPVSEEGITVAKQ